ncbi:hypothetical protein [Ralstonia solanacearum]|uniref:hypothetical protein n=1 Tax=Ralstonia solanacearum TaxID=305 RepID=UPI003CC6A8A5
MKAIANVDAMKWGLVGGFGDRDRDALPGSLHASCDVGFRLPIRDVPQCGALVGAVHAMRSAVAPPFQWNHDAFVGRRTRLTGGFSLL